MPKVSVIIPNYNHHVFLEQRINSVLNQTYQNFELILLDDASTDESQKILQQYSNHPKVSHVMYNGENSESVFKQWIKGIELAKGEYVWIAESDDYAAPRFLETTISVIETNEQLGLVFTDSFKVDSAGNELGQVSKSKKILKALAVEDCLVNSTNFTDYLLNKLVIVNASSVLFRKSALLALNFEMLKKFKNTGDVFVYVGIALNHDLFFLPEPLNYMRLHAHNTTKKNKKSGQLYKDKLLLLGCYLEDFSRAKVDGKDIVDFLYGFLFLSIDYGHIELLKKLLKKMYDNHFLKKRKYITAKSVVFFYRYLMYNGRPQFFREWLKSILKNSA